MLNKLAIVLLCSLTFYTVYISNKFKNANEQLEKVSNNLVYYQNFTSNVCEENRTLKLTVEDLRRSNDSIIVKIKEKSKELSIKDKELQQAQYQKQQINDSVRIVIKDKDIDFKSILKMNDQTFITVSRTDSVLDVKLDLTNEQFLYIKKKKVYRNQYKNGWVRFWHFDWKKDTVHEYEIKNSNDLIKVTETRVIEL